ncbi:hypothetical protein OROGR_002785 [Orobanche gracilis]
MTTAAGGPRTAVPAVLLPHARRRADIERRPREYKRSRLRRRVRWGGRGRVRQLHAQFHSISSGEQQRQCPDQRNTKIKAENSVKAENADVAKDGGDGSNNNSGGGLAMGLNGSITGIVVKEDTVKIIFTDNIQTSGAYSAREESLKRELRSV